MRASPFQAFPPLVFAALRHSALGALGGWVLLAICLSENIANLGYLVLGGGFWTLAMLVGAFGLAGAVLGAALSMIAQWQAQAASRAAVARLQLLPARAPNQTRASNQALR
ncbi:hypothetical protein [Pedomonas mirosovicensis]|uniref:hypothetical protein n=1 Tax=Pedomonas mirosovicensis TaxID=2908641 RepID=UPI0021682E31|nr:hypothetical protein [Pedomonas mirosovicensis]MCH8685527.1 hypothetical protein [Pedomonas mirosovicensis]